MSRAEGVEVLEAGRALKVHTDLPHLVSLGGGRLSTAVTLHPLPPGRVTLGSDPSVDIVIQGTGVEPTHCHIENSGGVVVLYPLADMTSVDNQRVSIPTRLSQGSTLCIGRSNYLRFNHPAEARYMKSILPNSRISMVPINYCSGMDGEDPFQPNPPFTSQKPPIVPKRSPRDSWGDVSNSSSCNSEDCCVLGKVSRFEYLAQKQAISPKVFPAGSATVNSPVSAVLGINTSPIRIAALNQQRSRSTTPTNQVFSPSPSPINVVNGTRSQSSTPTASLSSGYTKQSWSPPCYAQNSVSQYENIVPEKSCSPEHRIISTPSPAFNRNPGPYQWTARSITPSPPKATSAGALPTVGHRRTASVSNEALRNFKVGSPTPSYGSNCSIEELNARKEELEYKRQQAQKERLREQEAERQERARLEEILTMCAEYERQAQTERQTKPPTTPTIHQNRIKTNGSLPRDKRLMSPTNKSVEEELADIFTFDVSSSTGFSPPVSSPSSFANIAKNMEQTASPNQKTGRGPTTFSPYENVSIPVPGNVVYPQSPRTRIRTIATSKDQQQSRENCEVIENRLALTNDYEFVNSLPRIKHLPHNNGETDNGAQFKGDCMSEQVPKIHAEINSDSFKYSPKHFENLTYNAEKLNNSIEKKAEVNLNMYHQEVENLQVSPNKVVNKFDSANDLIYTENASKQANVSDKCTMRNGFSDTKKVVEENALSQKVTIVSSIMKSNEKSNLRLESDKFILPLENGFPNSPPKEKLLITHSAQKLNGDAHEHTNGHSKREISDSKCNINKRLSAEEIQIHNVERHTFLRQKIHNEAETLRKERSKLLSVMSNTKRKITDIEQQEEELLRELEIERALLDGEWQSQNDKLLQDEDKLIVLETRMKNLDREMDKGHKEEEKQQEECQRRLDEIHRESERLQHEMSLCNDNAERQRELGDKLSQQHELMESERKLFEDLEFHHLEQEASCLAQREELQRELNELCSRLELRRYQLQELEEQRRQAAQAAQAESQQLEQHLMVHLHTIDETRNKLRTIELQLEELMKHGALSSQDSSPDASSDVDEVDTVVREIKQSQDDLDRINRVTSKAPLEMSTGSLGRKTLASLREIERNRQLHLVQQGSIVIEEERKRVQELKRRVHDEVLAQWEERRQREANCNSLNSVGSDDVSLTSSDIPTESASSDDIDKNKRSEGVKSIVIESTEESDIPNSSKSQVENQVREKELELERDLEECRPLSDGSSYERQLAVRMRDKVAKLQRPLTRYLPIRSETLNLRNHIESAGHQIELCPHVSVDSTSCRGYLQKMGSKFHHWNKRWFVFDRTKRLFSYYSDRSEKKHRGGAYFQAIEEVYVDHMNSVKSPSPNLTFVVKTNERTYHLMAPSPEATRIWVDVIFTGAEGYQEFEHGS